MASQLLSPHRRSGTLHCSIYVQQVVQWLFSQRRDGHGSAVSQNPITDWQTLTDEDLILAYKKTMAGHDDETEDAAAAEMLRRDLDY